MLCGILRVVLQGVCKLVEFGRHSMIPVNKSLIAHMELGLKPKCLCYIDPSWPLRRVRMHDARNEEEAEHRQEYAKERLLVRDWRGEVRERHQDDREAR